ncbi:dienelactone hydrolase family protein [Streptomyces sp. NPDC057638]|uniref:dienelactone hydrolase family protein n=1 Tax=Streptomyces sp. NPDC057638 TaxID=3346190 RepID=UPI0036B9850F
MVSVTDTRVDVPLPDGTADALLAYPEDMGPCPGVLLYMDAFGPRPQLERMAHRLAASGYTVLVPNVFHRYGRAPLIDLPAVIDTARHPEIFQRLGPMIRSLTPELVARDADGCLRWLAASPLVAAGPVGVTGYCMGVRLALYTAAARPDRVTAVAGFHGAHLATTEPDSPHLLLDRVRAEVYLAHADADPSLPPEQIERLAGALRAAGVRHRAEVYPGARHGFTQADTVSYDHTADERHWAALLDLFARTLHGPPVP